MFSQVFLEFFKELAANNNKEWFDENRKRYENDIREPFKKFVGEVIEAIRQEDSKVAIEPKDAIFRINRDIRFAKDKTPYKTSTSAIVSRGGRKDKTSLGIYFELGPAGLELYGGSYFLDKEQLEEIRWQIVENEKRFNLLLSDPVFVKYWGAFEGEKHKRLAKNFKIAAEKQPLLFNKQFYYHASYPANRILEKGLLEFIIEHYRAADKMRAFFNEVLLPS